MGRSPSSSSSSSASASWDENGLKRGPWTPEEDDKLVRFIERHGHGSWRSLPNLAGLNRCGKSCRLRWTNYLRPDIKRGNFSQQEEQTILNLHAILGNKWSVIASHLPGRTDNEIKNFWNTHLEKKLIQMGFDPITHMPTTRSIPSNFPHLLPLADLQTLLVLDLPPLEQQEALQMATLEYLHRLLQLPPSPLTATFQPLQYDPNMSTPFAPLPDMEFCEASNDPTTAAHRGPDIPAVSGQGGASIWVPSSSSNAIQPQPPPPVGTNSTLINSGEICSSASNAESEAAPSAWADLGGLFFVQ